MKKALTVLSFIALISFSGYGQAGSEYRTSLKTMFELSGTEQNYQAAITQMFKMYQQQYAGIVDKETWQELQKEYMKASIDDLTDMLVPVYSKYLSQEDLEGIIAFYRTPVGKKYAKNTPYITTESMQVGQEWGMKLVQDFQEKLKERGY